MPIDRHEWTEECGTEYVVHRTLYPEGIVKESGLPAPANELAWEILRLAEENQRIQTAGPIAEAAYTAGSRNERDRIRRELLAALDSEEGIHAALDRICPE